MAKSNIINHELQQHTVMTLVSQLVGFDWHELNTCYTTTCLISRARPKAEESIHQRERERGVVTRSRPSVARQVLPLSREHISMVRPPHHYPEPLMRPSSVFSISICSRVQVNIWDPINSPFWRTIGKKILTTPKFLIILQLSQ